MGLLTDEIGQWKRAFGLLAGIPKTLKNNPANRATVDSVLGVTGMVPGLGDAQAGVMAANDLKRGDYLSAALNGIGVLPMVPALAGTFVGKGSKTWDALKNAEAVKMERAGQQPREIWSQTGNWKGPDKIWRQEIADDLIDIEKSHPASWLAEKANQSVKAKTLYEAKRLAAEYNDALDQVRLFNAGNGNMETMLLHRGLYDAYPDLRRTRVKWEIGNGGAYSPDKDVVSLGYPNIANMDNTKSTTLHELQHAIQQREGFARGGSPENLSMQLRAEADVLKRQASRLYDQAMSGDPLNPGEILKPGAFKKSFDLSTRAQKLEAEANRADEFVGLPYDAYRRLAGEAEARATQARMFLNDAQRRALFPEDSYDVPVNSLIVRFGEGLLR